MEKQKGDLEKHFDLWVRILSSNSRNFPKAPNFCRFIRDQIRDVTTDEMNIKFDQEFEQINWKKVRIVEYKTLSFRSLNNT